MIKFSVRPALVSANWTACPITPEWILEGAPTARIEHLSSSADGTASTYFWDCTAGRFNWFYSFDETLYILEGGMTLKESSGRTYPVVAGDTIFFPAGSSAEWTVQNYVRKVAFCRTPLPDGLVRLRTLARAVRGLVGGKKVSGGMFPAG
jgi:uncharacterized cupin superfamily protein